MSLKSLQPNEIVESQWLDTYYKFIQILTAQLVELNTTLFALVKIASFPFDLFQCDESFWSHFSVALVDKCILIIWRMAIDKSSDGLSISHLKNEIFKHSRNENIRKLLAKELEEGNYGNDLRSFADKIEAIRHKFIAHFSLSYIDEPDEKIFQETDISLSELISFRDSVESYFLLLCFGHNIQRLKYEYIEGHIMHPVNIQVILDSIAKDSIVIHLPETDYVKWKIFRQQITLEQLNILNEYRSRFKLPNLA